MKFYNIQDASVFDSPETYEIETELDNSMMGTGDNMTMSNLLWVLYGKHYVLFYVVYNKRIIRFHMMMNIKFNMNT